MLSVSAQLGCSLQNFNNIQNAVNPLSRKSTHHSQLTPIRYDHKMYIISSLYPLNTHIN